MNPNQPPLSMYDDQYCSQNTPDPLDEFLSQFLVPSTLPTHTPTYASTSAPALAPITIPALIPHLTCHWVLRHDPPLVCGAPLSNDPKHVCAHFRHAHNVRGNDRVTVNCPWHACHTAPMQKGSLTRHILTVHLELLRWECEVCGRVFSRKGTGHACGGGVGA